MENQYPKLFISLVTTGTCWYRDCWSSQQSSLRLHDCHCNLISMSSEAIGWQSAIWKIVRTIYQLGRTLHRHDVNPRETSLQHWKILGEENCIDKGSKRNCRDAGDIFLKRKRTDCPALCCCTSKNNNGCSALRGRGLLVFRVELVERRMMRHTNLLSAKVSTWGLT